MSLATPNFVSERSEESKNFNRTTVINIKKNQFLFA